MSVIHATQSGQSAAIEYAFLTPPGDTVQTRWSCDTGLKRITNLVAAITVMDKYHKYGDGNILDTALKARTSSSTFEHSITITGGTIIVEVSNMNISECTLVAINDPSKNEL